MEEDRTQTRTCLVNELKQTATKLLAEEREIYSVFELTGTVGRAQKRKYEINNLSNSVNALRGSSETKSNVSVETTEVAEATEVVVAEYQEVKDQLATVESYQLLIQLKLKLKLSKMIESH